MSGRGRGQSHAGWVIAGNVRAEIARAGLTSHRVAQLVGMTPPPFSARLRGRRPFDVVELIRIARVLDVPLAVLLAGAEEAEAEADGGDR